MAVLGSEYDHDATVGDRPTISIQLTNFWKETITREQAFQRLEGRRLPGDIHSRIAAEIPEETQHYLAFHRDRFRELADFGDGIARLLLLLPIKAEGNEYTVPVPIYGRDLMENGHSRRLFGIDLHEYTKNDKEQLVENGIVRDTFRFVEGPTTLTLDVAFLEPELTRRMRLPISCCGACHWVHSALDIHCADPICCFGDCGPIL